nr:MAG TPA: hypothetical protein [Caudoviricetes sp.]
MKYIDKETNPIIILSDIFIKKFFGILQIVKCLILAGT